MRPPTRTASLAQMTESLTCKVTAILYHDISVEMKCSTVIIIVSSSGITPAVVLCFACAQWVYSGSARDRGDQFVSDLIDIDADHEDAELEVDGSGREDDDDDDEQSGDTADDMASGGK